MSMWGGGLPLPCEAVAWIWRLPPVPDYGPLTLTAMDPPTLLSSSVLTV